jgi:hypothetical protein
MMSWPGSPRIRMRPIGPGSAMRFEVEWFVGEIRAMTLARTDDEDAGVARSGQHRLARLNRP